MTLTKKDMIFLCDVCSQEVKSIDHVCDDCNDMNIEHDAEGFVVSTRLIDEHNKIMVKASCTSDKRKSYEMLMEYLANQVDILSGDKK